MDGFTHRAGVFSMCVHGCLRMRIIIVQNGRCGIFSNEHDVLEGDGLNQLWHSFVKHIRQLLAAPRG